MRFTEEQKQAARDINDAKVAASKQAVITARIDAAIARNQSQRDIKAAFEAAFPGEIAAYAAANEKAEKEYEAEQRAIKRSVNKANREHNARAIKIAEEIGFTAVNMACHALAGYDYGVKGTSIHNVRELAKFTRRIPESSKYFRIMWDEYERVKEIYDNQPTRYKPYR